MQCEKKLAEDKLREEQERLARDLEERRQLEQKISEVKWLCVQSLKYLVRDVSAMLGEE